ncbi:MAG: DUF4126 domain-containing protein [Microbacteriaceae bacterium]|nr:DUF4126 domain-containing protein [Microbacteriaceae bacterium]
MEVLTGAGLATAAGLNAYIPLLVVGLSARFLDWIQLPPAWAWLSNEWVLLVIGVLLVLEIVADKIPALDSINDIVQTVVRPTAGGILFGTGTTSGTVAVTDPAEFFTSNQWVPIAIGVVLSLVVHVTKTMARPAANAASFGLAAPVLSTIEDGVSVFLTIVAIVLPILVIVGIIGTIVGGVALIRRARRRKRERQATPVPTAPA